MQQMDTRRAPQLQQAKVATAAEALQARHEKAARFTGRFECDVVLLDLFKENLNASKPTN